MAVHNLPHYSMPFVGRSQEIAQISDRFSDPGCRLLTLVGPGGIGKTRLAVQVALQLEGQFSNGVYFVPFQPLRSSAFMVSTIAEVVGLHFSPGSDPQQQLLHYLRNLELLLVFDNLEHLLDGASLLVSILRDAQGVSILATSRERLNLLEEWVFDVGGLDYPENESVLDIESYDAVSLFLNHVRRISAPGDLNSVQRSEVIRICQLVGGMPLGIELAAAWARTLSFNGIASGIESGLDILETSARNIEPRHRNIRATLEPMWNRLSDAQRSIFKRLSIFRGGFTRAAAEAVTGTSIHTLSALVDRSFVRMDDKGRYDLHELLHQFAEERLHESPDELQTMGEHHCRYFTTYLDRRSRDLKGKRQQTALEEIQEEIDDIRAAWAWAVEHKKESELGKACHALWFFYDTRSWYQEANLSLSAALAALGIDLPDAPESRLMGRLMAYYGATCYSLAMPDRAQDALEKSLVILRRVDAWPDIGFALLKLSEVALFSRNDPETAQYYLRESLSIFRELGDEWGTAYSLRWLGYASIYMGDYDEGQRLGEASLAIYERSGEPLGKALALTLVGICALEFGHYELAKEFSQDSLDSCDAAGLRWHPPFALITLGAAACSLGDYEQARQYLYTGLKDAFEIPLNVALLYGLLELAPWLTAMGEELKALEILSFLLAYPVPPVRGKLPVRQRLAKLQKERPDIFTESAMERARSLTLNALVESCLAILQQGITTTSQANRHPADRLTKRELDVIRLVASGMTNPQIAGELTLTVGTVKWYLHQIYTKLGVTNRTQASVVAQELNLLP
jgi:predicted ATPase/DNA-binding CsgD family transcriptional regulator